MSFPWVQVKDLNKGTFGFVQLAFDVHTGQRVAIKFIERGDKVSCFHTWRSCKRTEKVKGISGTQIFFRLGNRFVPYNSKFG